MNYYLEITNIISAERYITLMEKNNFESEPTIISRERNILCLVFEGMNNYLRERNSISRNEIIVCRGKEISIRVNEE